MIGGFVVELSLQPKKFINSEHIGNFATVSYTVLDRDEKPHKRTAKVHYMEEGVGEPLILVHSLGQSMYTWRNVFYELSKYYRVIAFDLMGHGYSDKPDDFDYTIDAQTEIIKGLCDAIDVRSAHFIGFSMGYAFVANMLAKYPQYVGRVIIEAPGSIVPEMPFAVRAIDNSFFGRLFSMFISVKTVRKVLEDCFFDLTFIKDEVVSEYFKTLASPQAKEAVWYSVRNFDDDEINSKLRQIQQEMMILWSSEDKWRGKETRDFFRAAVPNPVIKEIRNAGHLMHEEKMDKFLNAVMEYIPSDVLK